MSRVSMPALGVPVCSMARRRPKPCAARLRCSAGSAGGPRIHESTMPSTLFRSPEACGCDSAMSRMCAARTMWVRRLRLHSRRSWKRTAWPGRSINLQEGLIPRVGASTGASQTLPCALASPAGHPMSPSTARLRGRATPRGSPARGSRICRPPLRMCPMTSHQPPSGAPSPSRAPSAVSVGIAPSRHESSTAAARPALQGADPTARDDGDERRAPAPLTRGSLERYRHTDSGSGAVMRSV